MINIFDIAADRIRAIKTTRWIVRRITLSGICLFGLVFEDPSAGMDIGPIQIVNSDSTVTARIQFVGQLRSLWNDVDGGTEREQTLKLQARRVRPSLIIKLPQEHLTFKLHLSAAPGSLELMDFYFERDFHRNISIRAGQFKIPFTRYRIQSFQRLTFADWSIVTVYFGAERQMGIGIHNGYERPPRLGYALGVFSGTNARASHAVGLSKVYAEPVTNPSDLAHPSSTGSFHPEFVAHVAYSMGDIDIRSDSDEHQGEGLRCFWAGSLAWDIDPTEYFDLALRAAPELLIKYKGNSAMVAAYAGFTALDNSQRTRLAMSGLLLQTSRRFSSRCGVSLRYAIVNISSALAHDAANRGQALISIAEEQYHDSIISDRDFRQIVDRYGAAGALHREQELTAGFNFYLIGHSLKWQNDIGWIGHYLYDGERLDDIAVRLQLQIAI